ncbi:protein FAM135A isoform X3 [Jatropha curcas]|uniref:protein FAM135A isoform X3 n=1 Tax=Jatropha curcas TaxID=180498 RepID=UPI0018963241|nr:protein FAM135A isoform X3 [Jatropha curcas]
MWDTVQQIAIYIHRFHNLDLFQQGFYQIKVTMRWEDSEYASIGTPARVVQYEAHDMDSDSIYGAWRINDTDNSFLTQPFRIKYARQDVYLSVMISFDLSLSKYKVPSTSAVILKFELLQAPITENRLELLAYLEASSVAVHEFRIPPKALFGLHSYCPIHFDIFHAVLVEASVHVSLLKAGSHAHKSSDPYHLEDVPGESIDERPNQKANGIPDFEGDKLQYILSNDALENIFHLLGTQLSYLWSTFLQFHRTNKKKILRFLRDAWAKDRRTEWSIWMVYSKVEMPHHYISSGTHDASHIVVDKRVSSFWKLADDPAQTAATRAELHRRSIAQMRINASSIQDMYIFGDPLRVPIIYVERVINAPRRTFSENSYFRNLDLIDSPSLLAGPGPGTLKKLPGGNSHKKSRELKIVVFVHGFQGHHLDLRLIRNQWLLIDPKIEILMSEANEEKTSGDFREMGLRLAQEVISFLKKKSDKYSRSGGLRDIKLSFVGHSIGNVIIRTALAESIMEPFRRHLYTYISLSGPQLGYLYSSNSLFNSGMWFMKKFRGTQCIHQLTFTDDPNLKNTFFYRLCEQKTLENFRHIILISSPQDGYVPYHSARIELCRAASLDYSRKGRIFLEMLNNCLDQIRAPTSQPRVFMRCDVNFDTSNHGRNFNSFIGRTAHIEFLESDIFARFIMWSFQELFR